MGPISIPVPSAVRSIFNTFPLQTYPPTDNTDDRRQKTIDARTFSFQSLVEKEQQQTDIFALGVYNVYQHKSVVLTTDPECQYFQFLVCHRNSLRFPTSSSASSPLRSSSETVNRMITLSHQATFQRALPILIEDNKRTSKRRILVSLDPLGTETTTLNEEDKILMHLLDSILYDYWTSQLLFCTTASQFTQVMCYESPASGIMDQYSLTQAKIALSNRNSFSIRNTKLCKGLSLSLLLPGGQTRQELLDMLQERGQRTLTQFEGKMSHEKNKFLLHHDKVSLSDLKLASYILCILHLEDHTPIKSFVVEHCPSLIEHSHRVLALYTPLDK